MLFPKMHLIKLTKCNHKCTNFFFQNCNLIILLRKSVKLFSIKQPKIMLRCTPFLNCEPPGWACDIQLHGHRKSCHLCKKTVWLKLRAVDEVSAVCQTAICYKRDNSTEQYFACAIISLNVLYHCN